MCVMYLVCVLQNGMWKQHRQAVLECLEGFLQDPSTPGPQTHAALSVYNRFKLEVEKQQVFQALQNSDMDSHHLVILLDDNNYYHSMRYQVYQLARKRMFKINSNCTVTLMT